MKSWKYALVVALASAALFLPGTPSSTASADGPTVIRYASLAPPGSAFGKILRAWGRQFKKETEGRAELRFYTGGSQGDERDFIRKIRAGQIDAAGITTTGMGMIVRPILVLTAPGLITEFEQLVPCAHAATRVVSSKMFRDAGFELLHVGRWREEPSLFSTKPNSRGPIGFEVAGARGHGKTTPCLRGLPRVQSAPILCGSAPTRSMAACRPE